ncbi:MAG: YegS/Rv2252/BmrU family lipid kinase [Oscillospiraceae bacterium]|nr:YegS/Rv2252/BmrU family lipid kinase [Oscillospiraceae bacterium]MBR6114769.1 YegS/Rv2252/BmrU family lipid kinase [Oscillospiraceae bacterium]MBR7073544.1 YegS/Rv2252/BmrU family lipid kinase [Oscillospiraceae bacterium]
MKHLFIVNPAAGGHDATPEVTAKVQAAFQNRSDPYEVYVTLGPRDATRKIRTEISNCDELRVYACGGDGTFNECVNGAALQPTVAVTPFPTGTGNDFCRQFGQDAALFQDPEALLNGTVHEIDLICCNGSYSANICSVGIDARIGTDVHKYSGLPVIGGRGGYVISAGINAIKGVSSNMHIRCGRFDAEAKHSLVCACNGRFYGGGFNPSRDAMMDDGLMDIYIVKRVSLLTFARLIKKYAAGRADELPKYITHLRGTDLYIEFPGEEVINLDGEALYGDTVSMHLLPKAMKLIVPAGLGQGTANPPLCL